MHAGAQDGFRILDIRVIEKLFADIGLHDGLQLGIKPAGV
jgi:hypothetical protein